MLLWSKARILPVLLAAFSASVVFALLAKDTLVALPTLGTDAGRPLILFAPLLTCMGLAYCLGSSLPSAESTGTRRVTTLDQVLVVCTGLAAVASSTLIATLTAAPSVATAGRNTLFLAGLMLCVRALAGHQFAVITPAAWVIAMTLIGSDPAGHDRPWTVILMPPSHTGALVVAVAVFATGLALLPVRPQVADAE
ncbi:hypothetical protein [Streptomyces sp. NPDC005435]|uniref:hypothetical protein n=1 Tax=Streptomyces sp. NPDC005435 TaxID=3154464 RepID=UPI0034538117